MIPGAVNMFRAYTCLQITVIYSKSQITLLHNGMQQYLVQVDNTV
jgi:hypothetical protein